MNAATAETIVVTGASSGIGRELAVQLAAPGREIWLVGRNGGRLEEVAAEIRKKDGQAHVVRLNIRDLDASAGFLEKNFPAGRRVDEVYLAAAVTLFGEVKDTLGEDWDRLYQTNLLSPVQWLHHFYSNMVVRRTGKIVIVSSLAAYTGYPTATSYATMKAGLLGLFRSLWHEGKSHNVAIHLASPGYVDTGIYRSAVFRGTSYERTMSQIEALGFPVLSAEEAARIILRSIRRGKSQFAFPHYASLMKWVSPRMPFLMALVHMKIIKRFRSSP